MTTIAYRDGIIASDSRSTSGNFIFPGEAKKLTISEKHGCVFAAAGSYNKAIAFIRMLEKMPRLPWHLKDLISFGEPGEFSDFTILVVQQDRRVFAIDEGHYCEIFSDFYVVGSGSDAATAAMLMGASARKAIEIASQVDTNTDERVVSVNVVELKAPAYLNPVRAPSPKPRRRKAPAGSSQTRSRVSRKKRA